MARNSYINPFTLVAINCCPLIDKVIDKQTPKVFEYTQLRSEFYFKSTNFKFRCLQLRGSAPGFVKEIGEGVSP